MQCYFHFRGTTLWFNISVSCALLATIILPSLTIHHYYSIIDSLLYAVPFIPWIVHCKRVNFTSCELYPNEAVKKSKMLKDTTTWINLETLGWVKEVRLYRWDPNLVFIVLPARCSLPIRDHFFTVSKVTLWNIRHASSYWAAKGTELESSLKVKLSCRWKG